jgi:hypothetical protein
VKYHRQFVVHLVIARLQQWKSLGDEYDWTTHEEVNFVPLGHMVHDERTRVVQGFGPNADLGLAREMILWSQEMARRNGEILAMGRREGRGRMWKGRGGLMMHPGCPERYPAFEQARS